MYCQTDDLSSILCLDQINIGYNSLGHQFLSAIFFGDQEGFCQKGFCKDNFPLPPYARKYTLCLSIDIIRGTKF